MEATPAVPVMPEDQVKEKLSSLGINPSQVSSSGSSSVVGSTGKKPPIFLTVITLVLLLAAVGGGVFLVQKRQELRKKAETGVEVLPCNKAGGCCDPAQEPGCNCRIEGGYLEECTKSNPACTETGFSCCSRSGCTQDSDCCTNSCNEQTQTCTGGGTLECYADINGVRIVNHTGGQVTGEAEWFSNWCDDQNGQNCFCSGQPFSESVTLTDGEEWSRSIIGEGPPVNCAWQSDLDYSAGCSAANHGCADGCGLITPTPTPSTPTSSPTPTPPTPTPTGPTPTPPSGLTCVDLTMSPQPPFEIGDSVAFTCSYGRAINPYFDHFDYRLAISSGSWQLPAEWQNIKGATPPYKISLAGTYVVQCRVCGLEGECTGWGGAQGISTL